MTSRTRELIERAEATARMTHLLVDEIGETGLQMKLTQIRLTNWARRKGLGWAIKDDDHNRNGRQRV